MECVAAAAAPSTSFGFPAKMLAVMSTMSPKMLAVMSTMSPQMQQKRGLGCNASMAATVQLVDCAVFGFGIPNYIFCRHSDLSVSGDDVNDKRWQ